MLKTCTQAWRETIDRTTYHEVERSPDDESLTYNIDTSDRQPKHPTNHKADYTHNEDK